ncbi:hypothetical protein GOP47_0018832 [Adiantum capillus-veneris]|uniref:ABC transporter D family member 1 n=1 Tax=Adiantum capillus-veneris TaxID=13818 RepID=A0A9D4UDX8_ADICA|nr:hypothetical protein GOP47_0018832 [Adiantum capillus-veneris]
MDTMHIKHAQRRKAVIMASAAVLAGGSLMYARSLRPTRKFLAMKSPCANDDKRDKAFSIKRPRGKGMRSLRKLARIIINKMGTRGIRILLSLAITAVLKTALSNRLARVQGFLFRAAFLRQLPLFCRLIAENLLLCLLQSGFYSTTRFLTGMLSLQIRKVLTDHIHANYFQNMIYYKMSHVDTRIKNPEQRITSDIPKFSMEFSEVIQENLTAIFDGIVYTWRLCSYTSPKYAAWILAYLLGAGLVMRRISPAFGSLLAKEQHLEGDYKRIHTRLRTHSESIAFYGGQKRESSIIKQRFNDVIEHLKKVVHAHWWFGMMQDFTLKYLGATVGLVLIIEPFFNGNLRPGQSTLGRAEMLSNIRYHTSVITSLFQSYGSLVFSLHKLNRISGYADRLSKMMEVAQELHNADSLLGSSSQVSGGQFVEEKYIEFKDVKIATPTGNTLVENLTFRIERGSNLLIIGPNGSGKSSLFRVLGGLWPLVSGCIAKPGVGSYLNKEIFYVPQRPYTAVGTLRDQLIYPLTAAQETNPLTEEEIQELLKTVDLEYLLDRYPIGAVVNWGDELSLGEQQRLGMARLFYHKPSFAILDECTSAVTTDMEQRFCAKVRDMGTSCITISHRPALVAFHDVVLALDGEGSATLHYRRDETILHVDDPQSRGKTRQLDVTAVRDVFNRVHKDDECQEAADSYIEALITKSMQGTLEPLSSVPRLRSNPQNMATRVAALSKIVVPSLYSKQGSQLLAVALLVVARTLISDRIANLNGRSVKHVLNQDKAAFIQLVGVSVLQSGASAVVAPSLRYLIAALGLGWRKRTTDHLLDLYLTNNAFYKVFHVSETKVDADQRITQDVERLGIELSGLVTGMVKPLVDIIWFMWRMKMLTGTRGILILNVYMFLGLGFLRLITPDFGALAAQEQLLEGSFRYMDSRLHTHAESIAFFGGGLREQAIIEDRFSALMEHSKRLLLKRWLFDIADMFITKELPHNVTWGLSLLYAMENYNDNTSSAKQGELAHSLRFLASVVSQSFMAFGDLLELHKKFNNLSGGINRIMELNELLKSAQEELHQDGLHIPDQQGSDNVIFSDVDIITPGQKVLAKKLTFQVSPGKSLLVTGPNGAGKSSIVRALAELWPYPNGRIVKPALNGDSSSALAREIFYVPQRPYTALGTLRDQIIYPLTLDEAILKVAQTNKGGKAVELLDEKLLSILEEVHLVYLLEREGGWDSVANWEGMLSLGEQQRLGMARLFFHQPKFGVLDECTNATSVDVEDHLYKLAARMGITVITVSQRPALIPFHSMELHLIDGEGSWELRKVKSIGY